MYILAIHNIFEINTKNVNEEKTRLTITIVQLKFKICFKSLDFPDVCFIWPLSEGERLWNQENQGITQVLDIQSDNSDKNKNSTTPFQ